jgi:hypothetical protein
VACTALSKNQKNGPPKRAKMTNAMQDLYDGVTARKRIDAAGANSAQEFCWSRDSGGADQDAGPKFYLFETAYLTSEASRNHHSRTAVFPFKRQGWRGRHA